MPEITATVTKIEALESKKGVDYWKIHLKGKAYTAFDPDVVEGLHEGLLIRADVGEKKDGKYTNYYFNSYEIVGAALDPPPAPNGKGDTPATTDWEVKDRRIAMEAAYGSASRFMLAAATAGNQEAVTAKNLTALGRAIYKDVLAAGRGATFGAAKAEPPIPPSPPFDLDVPF